MSEWWTDLSEVLSLLSYLDDVGEITTAAEAIEVVCEPWSWSAERDAMWGSPAP